MTTSYVAGTVSVSAGGRTVTGIGTGWLTANIAPGFFALQGAVGPVIPVERIVSDTELLLYVDWPGATVSGASYWLSYDTRDGQQSVNNAIRLSEYIARLDSDSLSAIAALSPEANTLIMYTGSNTAVLIPTSQLGGLFDRQVPTIAGRAQFDDRPQGFRVLVSDNGEGISALYTKDSAASGDWSEPAFITGPRGEQGPSGGFTSITAGTTTTLPSGSDATVTPVEVSPGEVRLDFGLPRGQDGEGTGDVKGPSSSVSGRVAVFSGIDGKEIEDSGVELGSAASLDVGTSAGTVAAGDDPRFSQGGSSQNEAILALEIADLKGARLGMKGGVADAFDDETGVDVKTNAVYDATNDWYTPSVTNGPDLTTSAQAISGGSDPTGPAVNAFDKNTSTVWYSSQGGSSVSGAAWIGQDFSSNKAIRSITLQQRPVENTQISSVKFQYSDNGASWFDVVTLALVADTSVQTFAIPASGSHRYWRILANGSPSINASWGIAEMSMREAGTINNMTLISVAYPLASAPTNASLTVQTAEFEEVTANTDFVAEFSRDGGTTWTAGNLVLSPYLVVGAYKMYEATSFSVSGQPIGSSMRWRIRMLTNKNIAISGVVSQGG